MENCNGTKVQFDWKKKNHTDFSGLIDTHYVAGMQGDCYVLIE